MRGKKGKRGDRDILRIRPHIISSPISGVISPLNTWFPSLRNGVGVSSPYVGEAPS